MSALLLAPLYQQQDAEAAEDAREERIDALVPEIAAKLQRDKEFAGVALIELEWDAMSWLLRDLAEVAVTAEMSALSKLLGKVHAHVKAAAWDQAASDARDEVARLEAMDRADADEAKAA